MNNLPILYKKTKLDQIQQWQICFLENSYWTEEGIYNSKITKSLPIYCEGKNTGKKNETTPKQQAYKESLSKWKKRKENGYVENINDAKSGVPFFQPMLAQKYQDHKDELIYPVFSQPKLDGMRCIVTKEGMFSRNGKKIISAPHIYESLEHLFKIDENLIFDGELYSDKFKNDFNKIISLAKKTKPTDNDLEESKQLLEYHIYDFPSYIAPFGERFNSLPEINNESVIIVKTKMVMNQKELDKIYEEYLEAGYEGQIIRQHNRPYENERTSQLLKRKEFIDEEYIILDIEEGQGNRTGTAGYMIFETKEGKKFRSNIKGNFTYLKDILNKKESLIGKQATIKYFNLTPDGIPRFPYVIKIYEDGEKY